MPTSSHIRYSPQSSIYRYIVSLLLPTFQPSLFWLIISHHRVHSPLSPLTYPTQLLLYSASTILSSLCCVNAVFSILQTLTITSIFCSISDVSSLPHYLAFSFISCYPIESKTFYLATAHEKEKAHTDSHSVLRCDMRMSDDSRVQLLCPCLRACCLHLRATSR